MTTPAPPRKGILKKQPAALPGGDDGDGDGDGDGDDSAGWETTGRPRVSGATHSRRVRSEQEAAEIARKHAAILQQRRELEATIFTSIETLTEFPRSRDTPGVDAAHPDPADAAVFLQLVRVFQPGDYDDLVEERNTCGRCGYALCARPRQTFAGGGTWKLVNAGRRDFGIVAKAELEKWCSPACARRDLYIKVQLNETAAWERVGIPDIRVELLEEEDGAAKADQADQADQADRTADESSDADLARDMARLRLDEERRRAQIAQTLAVERGDARPGEDAADDAADRVDDQPPRMLPPAPPPALVDVQIVEKRVTTTATAPALQQAAADSPDEPTGTAGRRDAHTVVEGHKIRFAGEP